MQPGYLGMKAYDRCGGDAHFDQVRVSQLSYVDTDEPDRLS